MSSIGALEKYVYRLEESEESKTSPLDQKIKEATDPVFTNSCKLKDSVCFWERILTDEMPGLIDLSTRLAEGVTDEEERMVIFQNIVRLPQSQRTEIAELAILINEGCSDVTDRSSVLFELLCTSKDLRAKMDNIIPPLVKNIPDRLTRALIVRFVRELPSQALSDLTTLMTSIQDSKKRNLILNRILNLPLEKQILAIKSLSLNSLEIETMEVCRLENLLGNLHFSHKPML